MGVEGISVGTLLGFLATAAIAFFAGYLVRRRVAEGIVSEAERTAAQVVADARREAERLKKEALLEAKEEVHQQRLQFDRELRDRQRELAQQEQRLLKKEETLERKLEAVAARDGELRQKEAELDQRAEALARLQEEHRRRLEQVSGLTSEEARSMLLARVEEEAREEAAALARELERRAREEAEERARWIVSQAIERCAVDHVADATVSVVNLPSEDMKGRIIGKEGRNIRAFETLTGVDVVIDDTPEAILLSSFDPIRREVARLAMERLIADGRIHPARIEEMVDKARRDMEAAIRREGEQAALQVGVHGLHPELVKLLGRLKFRTSYGQNVLQHSVEVAQLAGHMAGELSADQRVARRAGLLHDIGKAVDREVEGSHLELGIELLRRYNEPERVIHAMACHHGDYEPQSVEAVLVTAADAISASRPGARRQSLESYIRRLEKLEAIADSFEGVAKAYAIQAGREIRIIVRPERVSDEDAARIAREVSKRIKQEVEFPGQVKVTVIRETRAVAYAR